MLRVYSFTAFVALAAMLGVLWFVTRSGPDDPCSTSSVAGGLDAIGGPFELVDHTGQSVTDADVITGPSILYFGYTFCPDVCPADTARNAMATDILTEAGYDVTPVFISIDPDRDTPDRVADFVFNLHEDMIGLTGSPEQVRAASQAYRTYYQKQEDGDPDYYLVDHSTFTYYVTPEQGTVAYFSRETTPQQMADQVACFIDSSR